MAEEIVEVDVDEKEIIGSPKTPNKDTNTIVKVVTGKDVTTPSEIKEEKSALKFQLVTKIILNNILPDQQDSARVRANKIKIKRISVNLNMNQI